MLTLVKATEGGICVQQIRGWAKQFVDGGRDSESQKKKNNGGRGGSSPQHAVTRRETRQGGSELNLALREPTLKHSWRSVGVEQALKMPGPQEGELEGGSFKKQNVSKGYSNPWNGRREFHKLTQSAANKEGCQ